MTISIIHSYAVYDIPILKHRHNINEKKEGTHDEEWQQQSETPTAGVDGARRGSENKGEGGAPTA